MLQFSSDFLTNELCFTLFLSWTVHPTIVKMSCTGEKKKKKKNPCNIKINKIKYKKTFERPYVLKLLIQHMLSASLPKNISKGRYILLIPNTNLEKRSELEASPLIETRTFRTFPHNMIYFQSTPHFLASCSLVFHSNSC